ncbi:MAG TPA: HAD family hydrolase [Firmicutes bacterium]|jgi:FMN phosphatase YigB (HAD superfamily)|nr:HAD family hydrolase [Bacillota bacterium]
MHLDLKITVAVSNDYKTGGSFTMIKHLLFDLDGTLLPIDLDFFFQDYLSALSARFTTIMTEKEFKDKLLASTMAMVKSEDATLTNEEVFWRDFPSRIGHPRSFLEPILRDFYNQEYRLLGKNIPPADSVRPLLTKAFQQGFSITIATNPIFPDYALLERLAWINCHDLPYRMVTAMENMHFCKPNPNYYREILDHLGAKAEECIMVGNDQEEDMVAALVGFKTCLVTDRLISRGKLKVKPDYTCSLAELPQILTDLITNPSAR